MMCNLAKQIYVDRDRYGKQLEEVGNTFFKGCDDYPKSLTDGYHLVSKWNMYSETLWMSEA